MDKELFSNFNHVDDQYWLVKVFFNMVYSDDSFLYVISRLIDKIGFTFNYNGCNFPDLSDPDPFYHFEGVLFTTWEYEILITEEKFVYFLTQACKLYLQKNPEDEEKLKEILNRGKEYQIKI